VKRFSVQITLETINQSGITSRFWAEHARQPARFRSMRTTQNLILAGLLFASSSAAIAQAPPAPGTPVQRTAPQSPQRAADCAPQDRPNRATAPDGVTTGQAGEPLGDKLAKSDGVLCPPSGVDPDMHAPAPSTDGKMPVIPPPGSPGGDPSVRPK
jgi:hypothetical protein